MNIQEFREKMKTADRSTLEKIAAELYKRIPKKTKVDELDDAIDQLLKDESPPKAPSKGDAPPFDQLEKEIRLFLSHVDANYYWEPNRVVPKAQRSKWRFVVMRFLKQLDTIGAEDENAEAAARLYLEIYNRLAYGCGYYIFPTEDPFAAIRRRQDEYYSMMIARFFAGGFSDAKILDMLRAATSVNIDRNTLYIELEQIFIQELRTRNMREKALAIAKEEVLRIETEELNNPKRTYDYREYECKRKICELCSVILGLGIATFDEEGAYGFFLKHYKDGTREIRLYVALKSIDTFGGAPSFWTKVYKDGIMAPMSRPAAKIQR